MDRQKALTDLYRLTKAVEDGKKAMADLEDEARVFFGKHRPGDRAAMHDA